ncbi:MAG: aminodeoxychorismate lyase [Neobacillus sp.]|jgi:cell division protein YceG involved in septum cleavage|nr:aminodeoxychorismate lyase [Neobacillus sp.]
MRINLLSSFTAGILITTTICGAVYFADKGDAPKVSAKTSEKTTSIKVQPSEEEMVENLVAKGYIVLPKAEYDKNLAAAKASGTKENVSEDKTPETTKTQVVLNITNGMTSGDVGYMLKDAGMIEDAYTFSTDIEKRGLQNKLRQGVFNIDSEMSLDQVISIIFKQ